MVKKTRTAKQAARAIKAAIKRGDDKAATKIAEDYCGAVDAFYDSPSYKQRMGRLHTQGVEPFGATWRVRPGFERRASWGPTSTITSRD